MATNTDVAAKPGQTWKFWAKVILAVSSFFLVLFVIFRIYFAIASRSSGAVTDAGPQLSSPQVLAEVPLFKKRSIVVTSQWSSKIYLRGNRLAMWNSDNVIGRSNVQDYVEKEPRKGGLSFAPATWVQLRAKTGTDEVTMCSHPVGTSGKEVCN